MYAWKRKRTTLTPALALVGLGALIALPVLSQSRLYAAAPARFASVTVSRGDSLWSIADHYTAADGNTQDTIDRILAANHLAGGTIVPGEHLRIPR